jgi:recombination protein RecA
LKEEERQRAIHLRLARMESVPRRPAGDLPTGFTAFDEALGAGFPRGRIVEIYGPSSCGKTTLALQAVAYLQSRGFTAAWIDADRTFDPAYAAGLGVAIERLPLAQPDCAEEALEVARQLANSAALDLLVLDSAAALVPRLELSAGLGASSPGLQSRVLASGLRKLVTAVVRTGASAVFLNQTRTRVERSGEESETSAGGPALKLFAAVRIAMEPAGGGRIRFRVLKNKLAATLAGRELEWRHGSGFAESL